MWLVLTLISYDINHSPDSFNSHIGSLFWVILLDGQNLGVAPGCFDPSDKRSIYLFLSVNRAIRVAIMSHGVNYFPDSCYFPF